jgi:archaeosine-15-forming tRNA-guanine transglycosylase
MKARVVVAYSMFNYAQVVTSTFIKLVLFCDNYLKATYKYKNACLNYH